MNTPEQQKANELVEKFEDLIGHSDLNICHTNDLDKETKQVSINCAIICVEECLEVELSKLTDTADQDYWNSILTILKSMK